MAGIAGPIISAAASAIQCAANIGLKIYEESKKGKKKSEINQLKSEISSLKSQLELIKDEAASFNSEKETVKSLLSTLQSSVEELRVNLSAPESIIETQNSFDSQYEEVDEIGEGVFSKVYRVKHKKTETLFAAKLLPLSQDNDDKSVERELKAMEKLTEHEHVLKIVDYFKNYVIKKSQVLVMPLCTNGTVNDLILAGKLTLEMKKKIMCGVLSGIRHIHKHKILHLDLKPDNFLMDNNDCVKISDFGVAKAFSKSHKAVSLYYNNNGTIGNVHIPKYYTPPELILVHQDKKAYDAAITFKVDIYQAGCSFISMILETAVTWNNMKFLIAPYIKNSRGLMMQLADAQIHETYDEKVESMFNKLSTSGLETILKIMTHVDPTERLNAESLLQKMHIIY